MELHGKEVVTQSKTLDRVTWSGKALSPGKRLTESKLSMLDRKAVELHLLGKPAWKIADLCGRSVQWVYGVLRSEEAISHKQQIMAYYDDRFQVLYKDVIDTIEDGLSSSDMSERLAAADKWLKAHGKFESKRDQGQVNITAEDIVFNILNQKAE